MAVYLLGPILGFFLALKGTTSLHGSSICVEEKAVVFIGGGGAGKSTIAAAFALRGFPVMTEDVSPLLPQSDSFHIVPGYPLVRLWPSSAEILFGSPSALPLLTPNWDKRYLQLDTDRGDFVNEARQLGAVYVMAPRSVGAGPMIEELSAREAILALITNTYANLLLDTQMRASEFEVLGRVARSVPIRRLTPNSDPAKLGAMCDLVIQDFLQIGAT